MYLHFAPIQVHLADSCLVIEVENDFTVYGDELKFGGGKVRILICCVLKPNKVGNLNS